MTSQPVRAVFVRMRAADCYGSMLRRQTARRRGGDDVASRKTGWILLVLLVAGVTLSVLVTIWAASSFRMID